MGACNSSGPAACGGRAQAADPAQASSAGRGGPLPTLLPDSAVRSGSKAGSRRTPGRQTPPDSTEQRRRSRADTADCVSRARLIPHTAGAIHERYTLDGELGQGTYGKVHKGTHVETGVVRAVKVVVKEGLQEIVQLRKEIKIMKLLDHPNIVKLFETLEDRTHLYLVLELCEGGELFDRIIEAGRFSEHEAAIVMQQILRAVFYMHDCDISHRDLKPENFLFKTKDPIENNVLKIIDFGLSCHSKRGAVHTQIAGSAQYVAPQVLQRRYDRMCDMWSVGCIMYVLLCGQSPFHGRDEKAVMAKVASGEFSFKGRNWAHISTDAKDLIRKLLKMEPSQRFTAEQALAHDWITLRAPQAEPVALEDGFLRKLRGFNEKCKLRKAALHIIAGHLEDSSPTRSIRKMFTALDSNEDGFLCMNELTWGLERGGVQEVHDLDEIFQGVDFTGTGAIDYTEFLAANLDKSILKEDICRSAFSVFDLDGDGRLSQGELKKVLCSGGASEHLALNYNGMDFQDFMRLVTGGSDSESSPEGADEAYAASSAGSDLVGKEADGDRIAQGVRDFI